MVEVTLSYRQWQALYALQGVPHATVRGVTDLVNADKALGAKVPNSTMHGAVGALVAAGLVGRARDAGADDGVSSWRVTDTGRALRFRGAPRCPGQQQVVDHNRRVRRAREVAAPTSEGPQHGRRGQATAAPDRHPNQGEDAGQDGAAPPQVAQQADTPRPPHAPAMLRGQLLAAAQEGQRLAAAVRELEAVHLAVRQALGAAPGVDLATAAGASRAAGLAARAEVEALAATVAALRDELEASREQAARLADAGAVRTSERDEAVQARDEAVRTRDEAVQARQKLARHVSDAGRFRAAWAALATRAGQALEDACTMTERDLVAEIAEAYMRGDHPTAACRALECRAVRMLQRVARTHRGEDAARVPA